MEMRKVRFKKKYQQYNKGEIAGFTSKKTAWFEKNNIATDIGLVDKPTPKPTDKIEKFNMGDKFKKELIGSLDKITEKMEEMESRIEELKKNQYTEKQIVNSTVEELRDIARELDVDYKGLKKDELVDKLIEEIGG